MGRYVTSPGSYLLAFPVSVISSNAGEVDEFERNGSILVCGGELSYKRKMYFSAKLRRLGPFRES